MSKDFKNRVKNRVMERCIPPLDHWCRGKVNVEIAIWHFLGLRPPGPQAPRPSGPQALRPPGSRPQISFGGTKFGYRTSEFHSAVNEVIPALHQHISLSGIRLPKFFWNISLEWYVMLISLSSKFMRFNFGRRIPLNDGKVFFEFRKKLHSRGSGK